ncbi:TetR/AcrR family transcriptional regulator [Nonomuraea sp. NN258]|uniref:TetR/AcrR family transcriptional regulator n=1 Tax=Nonomuraea antri TaxID=2730852 RepID=UPI001569337A|nr:TetR/AcrR family transcriptional regulator [Nonomuraea antri]NRQ31171.1 TetR/AcrR family transcriptional regulator [Nonomuraea antri]
MKSTTRSPGRPRSQEADAAILAAALDLLIEYGAAQLSIEQVAQRAGVTRATVYRRFADKTALLVQALEVANHDHDPAFAGWRDLDHMLAEWADYLSRPRYRRLLRRLFGAVDDYPELVSTYRSVNSGRRAAAVREALGQAQERGELPPGLDVAVVQELLNGVIMGHLGLQPDTSTAAEIKAYLVAIMEQVGYRPVRADG